MVETKCVECGSALYRKGYDRGRREAFAEAIEIAEKTKWHDVRNDADEVIHYNAAYNNACNNIIKKLESAAKGG